MLKFNQLCTVLLLFFLSFVGTAHAQEQYTVSGQVVDQQGTPITGAAVVEKATSRGAITGVDGSFSFNVTSSDAVVVISFLGYETMEIIASSPLLQTPVVLEQSDQHIDDVVVIGYGTVRKKDLTGSVAVVQAEELHRGAVASPQDLMIGKIPGLHIVPGDGGPGSGSQIRIRGMASLHASNDPLIVIDGVPVSNDGAPGMSNPLNTINPNDIESFTVLKDASSTAIYGSRASNGVIIITTKKGGGKKLNLNYTSSYSISTNPNRVKMMSGDEYRATMDEFIPAGTSIGDQVRALMGTGDTNWQDQIFRNAFVTDHNVSAHGSLNKNLPYRISLGYANEEGTLKSSKLERTTLDISLAPKFLDEHLQVSFNAKGVYNYNRIADDGAVNAAAFFDPTQTTRFHNEDGTINPELANGYWNWYSATTGDQKPKPNFLAPMNPLSLLYDRRNVNDAYRMLGNIQIDYKLHWLPQLRFNLNLGLDMARTTGQDGVMPGSIQADRDSDTRSAGLGTYSKYTDMRSNELLEFYVAYADEIGAHRYDVMGGYSWQHYYTKNNSTRYVNTTDVVFNDPPIFRTENYQLSFFARANYTYDDRYMFTVSYRRDGSSRFHKDNRWGNFPAAAFAWNLINENFMRGTSALSNLKVRLSWGKTGQQDLMLDDYPYMPRYNLSSNDYNHYLLDGEYYSPLRPNAYDEGIKWEVTTTYNAGIDFGFCNGRINGSVDYYWRKTSDLLNETNVPMGSNYSNRVTTNIGNMENQGVEIALGLVPIQTKDWTLNVGFNATWQQTKITKLTLAGLSSDLINVGGIKGGTGSTVQVHKVGSAPYTFYTYRQVYDKNGDPIQNAFVDMNGDNIINTEDRVVTGKKPTPDWYFGLNANLSFRNWDFGFNAHGSVGNWMFNNFASDNSTLNASFVNQGFLRNYAQSVKRTGFTKTNDGPQETSDIFLENASFFRMDDITLGYTFPKLGNSGLKLRTAFTVQNVFVITDYSGLDPEGWGIDYNIWPRPRIFSLRLNLSF